MAGTARMVPATRPCRRSWSVSPSIGSEGGDDLELTRLSLLEADLAVDDVSGVGEVARPARALVVDRLALGEHLEPFDRAVHPDPRALGDLPYVVAHRGSGRLAPSVGDGEADQARVVVTLAGVGIELVAPERLREPP